MHVNTSNSLKINHFIYFVHLSSVNLETSRNIDEFLKVQVRRRICQYILYITYTVVDRYTAVESHNVYGISSTCVIKKMKLHTYYVMI